MRQYVLKRLALMIPTLLLISAIVFTLNHMLPGDVVVLMFEEKAYAKDLDALRSAGLKGAFMDPFTPLIDDLLGEVEPAVPSDGPAPTATTVAKGTAAPDGSPLPY